MAVRNKLSHFLLRRGVTTGTLAEAVQDGNSTALAMIEQGRALPTKSDLDAICALLGVKSVDIWRAPDLDLLDLLPEGNGRQHGDQTEFRAWVEKDFKRRLDAAIRQLGYKSSAAWFRRVAELTIRTAAKRKEEKRGM